MIEDGQAMVAVFCLFCLIGLFVIGLMVRCDRLEERIAELEKRK